MWVNLYILLIFAGFVCLAQYLVARAGWHYFFVKGDEFAVKSGVRVKHVSGSIHKASYYQSFTIWASKDGISVGPRYPGQCFHYLGFASYKYLTNACIVKEMVEDVLELSFQRNNIKAKFLIPLNKEGRKVIPLVKRVVNVKRR